MTPTEDEIEKARAELEEWSEFLAIKNTWIYLEFLKRTEKTIAFFTGNQWGKNVNIVKHYITRWMGKHPVESKNLRPNHKIRTYRFCSETVPFDPTGEGSNTIYPVLKKFLPAKFVLEDVNQRRNTMKIMDFQGGPPFFVEFSSYNQTLQKQAGTQRSSVYLDENCPRSYMEEQKPRLLASDGDMVIGMTPALGQITWQFEDIYEKASTLIRTERVCKRLKERFGEDHPRIENTGSGTDICVLMAATDDNPAYDVLVENKNKSEIELIRNKKHLVYLNENEYKPITKSEYIKNKLDIFDKETEDVRRYGIFRQVSGRIFKDFEINIHRIDEEKYFPDGVPHEWMLGRGIDYHQHVDWHCGFMALSPTDEAFIFDELVISPEKFVTHQIARKIAEKSKDYKFHYSLIDPLATQIQANTSLSTVDDLNRIFPELKREGIGTGGYWTSWDTKGNRGREEIRKRLKNSRLCGKPFNNKSIVMGKPVNLPTIWIFSRCRVTLDYMKNWRLEEWADRTKLETKEMKETPMQKYSHMNMIWEALFKEEGFKPRRIGPPLPQRHTISQYGRR